MDNAPVYLYAKLFGPDAITGDVNMACGFKGNSFDLVTAFCHIAKNLAEHFEMEPKSFLRSIVPLIDNLIVETGPATIIDFAALREQMDGEPGLTALLCLLCIVALLGWFLYYIMVRALLLIVKRFGIPLTREIIDEAIGSVVDQLFHPAPK